MDMSKQFFYLLQHRKKRRKDDRSQLAAQLAPLEEQDIHAAKKQIAEAATSGSKDGNHGSIVVDSGSLKLPSVALEGREEKRFFGIEPVVLVILILMLGFIAFIAWQISLMPPE